MHSGIGSRLRYNKVSHMVVEQNPSEYREAMANSRDDQARMTDDGGQPTYTGPVQGAAPPVPQGQDDAVPQHVNAGAVAWPTRAHTFSRFSRVQASIFVHLPPLRHMPPRGFKLHKLLGVFLAPDDPLWILDPPTSESASAMTTSPPSTKGRRSDTPPARALQEAPATSSRFRAPATPAGQPVAQSSRPEAVAAPATPAWRPGAADARRRAPARRRPRARPCCRCLQAVLPRAWKRHVGLLFLAFLLATVGQPDMLRSVRRAGQAAARVFGVRCRSVRSRSQRHCQRCRCGSGGGGGCVLGPG